MCHFLILSKVAQFASRVAALTQYHHGENSVSATIINMAQDFMGSNNVNLLVPSGQFGTRHQVRFSRKMHDVVIQRLLFLGF